MPLSARATSHTVVLHCVRVAGEFVHPSPLLLQATHAPDLRKLVVDQGYRWGGIFAVHDSVIDGQSHLALAVLCEQVDADGAGPWGGLIADEWIRGPWIAAGTCKSLSIIDFHAWPTETFNPEGTCRPDLVAFISVLRGGPAGLEIVMVEEPERKWSPAGGRWFLPAGHIDAGESFLDGARREVLEEAGISVEIMGVLAFVHRARRGGGGCAGPHLLLAARPSPDIAIGVDERPLLKTEADKESLSARWWPLDDIIATARFQQADTFFREPAEMRVHLDIIAAGCQPVPIESTSAVQTMCRPYLADSM